MRTVVVLCISLCVLVGSCSKPRNNAAPGEPTNASTRLDPERRYIRSFEKDRKRLTDRSLRKRYNLTPSESRKLQREIEKNSARTSTTTG